MSDVPAAYRASKGSVLDVDKEFYKVTFRILLDDF